MPLLANFKILRNRSENETKFFKNMQIFIFIDMSIEVGGAA